MADPLTSINKVLLQEDSTLSGVVTVDRGLRTRFGIAEKFHPHLHEIGFYTTMPTQQALGVAKSTLLNEYSIPLQLALIPDQAIADKLLSLAVNDGPTYPVEWLQAAVGCSVDGKMGPATLGALRSADFEKVLDALKENAVAYYRADVRNHPEDQRYLNGWINRANA